MATLSQPSSRAEVINVAGCPTLAPSVNPAVDLRVVPLTVIEGRLQVGLLGFPDRHLPGGIPTADRTLDAEARRVVREAAGLSERYLEQLFTLSVEGERGWTVIVSYLALIDPGDSEESAPASSWFDVGEPGLLADDDQKVLDYATVRLRAKIGYSNIAFHLLPLTFTLRELQTAYEAILGHPLDKRNFRRRVIAAELIEATGSKRRDGSHRPALLYRFRADHDPATYLTPTWGNEGGGDANEPNEDGV